MQLEKETINLLKEAVEKLGSGFDLPEIQHAYDYDAMKEILGQVAERMQDNYPYFHPLFAGQMIKPPHPIARTAYLLAMWINPNNHALDGGKASSEMEKEVVSDLARMFGYSQHLGHLTGGGTMANMEALWIAGKLNPDGLIVASDQAHYTHERVCDVLKIPFQKVSSDRNGRMDMTALEELLKSRKVGTVVVTMGTTGLGMVDPLDQVLKLKEKYDFRVHADAAYGGYFRLAENLRSDTFKNYQLMEEADSIVIDPHKHGLQPYGCGCILFKDPQVAKFYLHDSPYTYFTSDELHLGEISLECSRAGASAVALWATHKLLPPVEGGAFAKDMAKCREAAVLLTQKIKADTRFMRINDPDIDIVVWAVKGATTVEMSEQADNLFAKAAQNDLHLSKIKIPVGKLELTDVEMNSETVTCLRSCLLKPEHKDWLEEIWKKISDS